MALTPENYSEAIDDMIEGEEEAEVVVEPSKTWAIDFANGSIGKQIDDDAALRQFIHKALITERDKYAIYSDEYGCDLHELIGEDVTEALLESEVPRMVYEALAYDDRIDDVQTTYVREGDRLFVEVVVVTVQGDGEVTEEVELDVRI